MSSVKLKQKDLKEYRSNLLREQKGICPLCKHKIKDKEAVLDHDHKTGLCRRVLHRRCNAIEGKFANWFRSYGHPNGVCPSVILPAIVDYWDADYSGSVLHPTHKTPKDKAIRDLRRRYRKAKRDSTKKRLREQIDLLLKGEDNA